MSKTVKILLGILLFLVLMLAAVAIGLDNFMEREIEDRSSEILQTQVSIANLSLSLFGGSGSIKGFKVQNPDGFSEHTALLFEEADIHVELSSLFSDKIVVHQLIIRRPHIYFEQQGTQVNLNELRKNLETVSAGEADKALIIEYLLIEEGVITLNTSIDRENETRVELEFFELEGIGREGNNTVQQSMKQVLEPLLEHALKEAARKGVLEQLEQRLQNFFE